MQDYFGDWLAVSRVSLAAVGVVVAATGANAQLGGVGGALRGAGDVVGGAGRAVDRSVDRTVDRTERQVDRTLDRVDRQLDRAELQRDRADRRAERALDGRYDDGRGPVRRALGDAVRGAGRVADDAARVATGRGRLGVTFGAARDGGIVVSNVGENSAAYRAGIREGDEIVSIGGRRFDDYEDATAYIRDYRDDRLDFIVLRDGRRMNLSADLGAAVDFESRTAFRGDRPTLGVWFDSNAGDTTILRVAEGSPAFRAGIRPGDRILALDGRRVTAYRDVTRYLADLQPGEQVDILVWRNGRQLRLDATLATADELAGGEPRTYYDERRFDRYDSDRPSLGVVFDDDDRDSLMIARVESGSPAYRAGLRRGDRIYSIDGRGISGYRELTSTLARLEADADVAIGVIRDGRRVTLDATLAARSDVFDDARAGERTADRRGERFDERFDERRDRMADRFDERMDRTRDRFDNRSDRFTERFDDRRERAGDRFAEERDGFRSEADRRARDARDGWDETREARRSEMDRTRDGVGENVEDEADDLRSGAREAFDDARNHARESTEGHRDRSGENRGRNDVNRDDSGENRNRSDGETGSERRPPEEPHDESSRNSKNDEGGSSNESGNEGAHSDE